MFEMLLPIQIVYIQIANEHFNFFVHIGPKNLRHCYGNVLVAFFMCQKAW